MQAQRNGDQLCGARAARSEAVSMQLQACYPEVKGPLATGKQL